ncbi:MAG: HDOD domain-containing protein, partial [Phycisphaerales bacterium]
MVNEPSARSLTHELEHTLYQMDGLSVLPAAATTLLRGLFEMNLSPDELNSIAESDPAIAVMLLSLLHRRGIRQKQNRISVRTVIQELSLREIRDNFFAAKIYLPAGNDPARLELRRNLAAFAAAVGNCARAVTEQGSADIEPELAFAAGLLHNIGNLALDEAMPRSFQRLIEQAKTKQLSITTVQQQNLGLDYTTLGKRLAQRWHLPEPVTMAIWLHQSDTEAITPIVPQAKIAQVVRLAYLISRRAGIGTSASFDATELPDELLNSLGITAEQAEQIGDEATQAAAEKSQYSGTDIQTDIAQYCNALQLAAENLAVEGSKLNQQVQQSHTKSSHFDFTSELLTTFEPAAEPMEIAQNFASHFRKFYQTGKTCIYLIDPQEANRAEAVIIENNNGIRTTRLSIPADVSAVPDDIANNFSVIDAAQNCGWIFDQLDLEFNTARTKIAPLITQGSALGAILFEFSYPVQTAQLKEMFEATSFIAAVLLNMAMCRQKQQQFAEAFAQLITRPAAAQQPPVRNTQQLILSALA